MSASPSHGKHADNNILCIIYSLLSAFFSFSETRRQFLTGTGFPPFPPKLVAFGHWEQKEPVQPGLEASLGWRLLWGKNSIVFTGGKVGLLDLQYFYGIRGETNRGITTRAHTLFLMDFSLITPNQKQLHWV